LAGKPVPVIGLALFACLAGCAQPTLPPQDAMDGVYKNPDCPSFEILGGTMRFEGGEVSGKVAHKKLGLVLEAKGEVRYIRDAEGCRLVKAGDKGSILLAERKAFANPVIMIELFASDQVRGMYWTRTGPPRTEQAALEGKAPND